MTSYEANFQANCQQLIQQWQGEDILLFAGATEEEFAFLENCLGLKLPEDFRYFYALANGMERNMDKYMFCLWPLTEIADRAVHYPKTASGKTELIPFGDFLIDSHRYLLKTDGSGSYHITSENDLEERLADCFAHFIQRYLSEPQNLYLWL